MLKQLDADRNVVLVMTPAEHVRIQEIIDAGITAVEFGMARVVPEVTPVIADFLAAGFLLTDAELIEGRMAPHRNHEGDDLPALEELFTESVQRGRARAEEHGYYVA